MVIYVDVLLTVNWVIDFLLLRAEAHLLCLSIGRWRLPLAAAVGAVSSLTVLLPPLPTAAVWGIQLAVAAAMTGVAFGFLSPKQAAVRVTVLFALSAGVAGVATAVWWWLAPQAVQVINGAVYWNVSPLWLILSVAAAYGLMRVYGWAVSRHRRSVAVYYRVLAVCGGKQVVFRALLDTGNRLSEPFSGAPVVVAAYEAVAPLVTPAWNRPMPSLPCGARMVPYEAVGHSGILPAFRPERLVVWNDRHCCDVTGAYIAVTATAPDGGCAALLGAGVPESGRHCERPMAIKEEI